MTRPVAMSCIADTIFGFPSATGLESTLPFFVRTSAPSLGFVTATPCTKAPFFAVCSPGAFLVRFDCGPDLGEEAGQHAKFSAAGCLRRRFGVTFGFYNNCNGSV